MGGREGPDSSIFPGLAPEGFPGGRVVTGGGIFYVHLIPERYIKIRRSCTVGKYTVRPMDPSWVWGIPAVILLLTHCRLFVCMCFFAVWCWCAIFSGRPFLLGGIL